MSRPIQLKITNDVTVILDNVVSYAVEKGIAFRKPKPNAKPDDEGNYAPEDYDIKAADTISIFFVGGNGLTFRVGEEITREDYDRVSKTLKVLEFKLRDDGNAGSDRVAEGA